jgi:hypothetical protein
MIAISVLPREAFEPERWIYFRQDAPALRHVPAIKRLEVNLAIEFLPQNAAGDYWRVSPGLSTLRPIHECYFATKS